MKRLLLFAAAGLLIGSLALGVATAHASMGASKAVAAAVADPARPAADRARDALRKPAACLAFAGVEPGMTIAELLPGTGYFTRIFSRAVGPKGHVYEIVGDAKEAAVIQAIADNPHYYHNITVLVESMTKISVPKPVNLVWTSQNYHDIHRIPGLDIGNFDRAVYGALAPGGIFLLLDHAAPAGAGLTETALHRIDPQTAKKEVLSAGFQFLGQSNVLHNPNDPLTKTVFDPSIRGRTDQFIYKFRRPE
jgi:predicted methyltransferase